MSPTGQPPSRRLASGPGPGVLRIVAVLVALAAAYSLVLHIPANIPPDVRNDAARLAAEHAPDFGVESVEAYWRPTGAAVDVHLGQDDTYRIYHYEYRGGELVPNGFTMGGHGAYTLFFAVIAGALGLTWLIVETSLRLFSPKCPHHRGVRLTRERVRRLFPGGVNNEGLWLPAIDLVEFRCPLGDHVRRRVVEGPYWPSPDTGELVAPRFEAWMLQLPIPRSPFRLFRRQRTDEQWRHMFEEFRAQYEH